MNLTTAILSTLRDCLVNFALWIFVTLAAALIIALWLTVVIGSWFIHPVLGAFVALVVIAGWVNS